MIALKKNKLTMDDTGSTEIVRRNNTEKFNSIVTPRKYTNSLNSGMLKNLSYSQILIYQFLPPVFPTSTGSPHFLI